LLIGFSKLRLGTPEFDSSTKGRTKVCRAEAHWRRRMNFYYVYILQSEVEPERFYTGFTEDLEARLKSHNSGGCYHTSKYKPWHIKTAVAFGDRQKALDFEKYLKSPSGRAFAKKRL
jgi:putative endonuclease